MKYPWLNMVNTLAIHLWQATKHHVTWTRVPPGDIFLTSGRGENFSTACDAAIVQLGGDHRLVLFKFLAWDRLGQKLWTRVLVSKLGIP